MSDTQINRMATIADATRFFRALGDHMRLQIVALIANKKGGLCVSHLQHILKLTQPAVSRHLAVLRNAGVLTFRRDQQRVYYELALHPDEPRKQATEGLISAFRADKQLRALVQKAFTKLGA